MRDDDGPRDPSVTKRELFRRVASLNRGFNCIESERQEVLQLVETLENYPSDLPCVGFGTEAGALAAGEWRLVFTTALDVLSVGISPFSEIGQIYQNINDEGDLVTNIIELQPKIAALVNPLIGSSVTR